MRFGGHQTFFIRDGWMFKALEMLIQDQNREEKLLTHDFSADYLGVGKNMAIAIRHWLIATGLAAKTKKKKYEPTDIAKIIYENDKYFTQIGTWWILHTNLLHSLENAYSWYWFFNKFNFERFDRSTLRDLLIRSLTLSKGRVPSEKTIDRDLICMLNSYSRQIPIIEKDPEESIESPFMELNLMNYYRDSAMYKVNRNSKKIDFEIFMYANSLLMYKKDNDFTDITFYNLVNLENGPSKVFLLDNESLFELIVKFENLESDTIKIRGLAGERQLVFENHTPLYWVSRFYERKGSI